MFCRHNTAPLLGRGYSVAIVTYSALSTNPQLYHDFVRGAPCAVIPDEAMYLGVDQPWGTFGAPLREGRVLIPGSGTPWRTNNTEIPFYSYQRALTEAGVRYPHLDINYRMRNGIGDCVIRPVEFHLYDGCAKYKYDGTGDVMDLTFDATPSSEESAVLNTWLDDIGAVTKLIDNAVEHWRGWRAQHNYPSRMLVVARGEDDAHSIVGILKQRHGLRVAKATMRDQDAHAVITRFRREPETADALVGIGMIHVGLDVPDCTHQVYLTNVRALMSVIQTIQRIGRRDYRAEAAGVVFERQLGHLFSPDDMAMQRVSAWWQDETRIGIRDREERAERAASSAADRTTRIRVPLGASTGEARHVDFREQVGRTEAGELELERIRREVPEARALPHILLAKVARSVRRDTGTSVEAVAPVTTTSDRIEALAALLDDCTKRIDGLEKSRDGEFKWGTTNERLRRVHGRRDDVRKSEDALVRCVRTCIEWFRQLGDDRAAARTELRLNELAQRVAV